MTIADYKQQLMQYENGDGALFWFTDMRGFQEWEGINTDEQNLLIPTYEANNSELALIYANQVPITLSEVDILCYCFETIENSHSMLPSLRMKNHFHMKKCFPYAIGQQGSLSIVTGLQLTQYLMRTEGWSQSLVTVIDSVKAPFHRFNFAGYIKGDAATFCILDANQGVYEIITSEVYPVPPSQVLPGEWNVSDYLVQEEKLWVAFSQVMEKISSIHSIDLLISHHLSKRFIIQVEQISRRYDTKVYARMGWKHINFLGSDPLYSLCVAEAEGALSAGCNILLLFGSVHHGIGLLLLQKRE